MEPTKDQSAHSDGSLEPDDSLQTEMVFPGRPWEGNRNPIPKMENSEHGFVDAQEDGWNSRSFNQESLTDSQCNASLEDLVKDMKKKEKLRDHGLSMDNQTKIYEDISRAICRITMTAYSERQEDFSRPWNGTGFLVSLPVGRNGAAVHGLLTNHHVIPHRPHDRYPLRLHFEKSGRPAVTVTNKQIAGFYTRNEICQHVSFKYDFEKCEKIDATFITFTEDLVDTLSDAYVLETAQTDHITIGENLVVIGHPGYHDGSKMKIEAGKASTTKGFSFFHEASTLGGSSGSPVLNDKLQVVGLHRMGCAETIKSFRRYTFPWYFERHDYPFGYNKATFLHQIQEDVKILMENGMSGFPFTDSKHLQTVTKEMRARARTLGARLPSGRGPFVFDFSSKEEKQQWAYMLIDDGKSKVMEMGVIILPQFGGFILTLFLEKNMGDIHLLAKLHEENPPNYKSVTFHFLLKLDVTAHSADIPNTQEETPMLPACVSHSILIRDLYFKSLPWRNYSPERPPKIELYVYRIENDGVLTDP